MGGSSSSNTTNKATEFQNVGGAQGGIAGNINLAESDLEIGDITETDHGAVAAGTRLGEKALDLGDKQHARAFEGVGAAYDDAQASREMSEKLFGTASGAITDATRGTMQKMQQSTDRALGFAKQATRSEAGEMTRNLAKWGISGAAALAVTIALINRG